MKKTNNNFFIGYRPSFLHVLGVLIIIAGLVLLWFAANGMERKTVKSSEKISIDDVDAENSGIIVTPDSAAKSRFGIADRIGIAILGGLLILGGVPLFYVPHAEKGRKFRRTKKEDAERPDDPEFDYPDDEFDFIIVKNVRDELLNEKLKNIRRKQNRK